VNKKPKDTTLASPRGAPPRTPPLFKPLRLARVFFPIRRSAIESAPSIIAGAARDE
jgi:hypothetical protein